MKYLLRLESQGRRTEKYRRESCALPNSWRMIVDAANEKEALQKAFSKGEPNPFEFKNDEKFNIEVAEMSGYGHHGDIRIFDVLVDIRWGDRFWMHAFTVEMTKMENIPVVDRIEGGCNVAVFKEYDREAAKKADERSEKILKEATKGTDGWMIVE